MGVEGASPEDCRYSSAFVATTNSLLPFRAVSVRPKPNKKKTKTNTSSGKQVNNRDHEESLDDQWKTFLFFKNPYTDVLLQGFVRGSIPAWWKHNWVGRW